jgi:hypothetical protein
MAPIAAVSQTTVKKEYCRAATQGAIPNVGSLICDVSTICGRQWWSSLSFEDTQIVVSKDHRGISLLDSGQVLVFLLSNKFFRT